MIDGITFYDYYFNNSKVTMIIGENYYGNFLCGFLGFYLKVSFKCKYRPIQINQPIPISPNRSIVFYFISEPVQKVWSLVKSYHFHDGY